MIRERRELVGVSQRELARRTGIAQARLSRMEGGDIEPTKGDLRLIETALGDLARSPEPDVDFGVPREASGRLHVPRPGRWAYRCLHGGCGARRFFSSEPAEVPSCHGRMVRDANRPYRGMEIPDGPQQRVGGVRPPDGITFGGKPKKDKD